MYSNDVAFHICKGKVDEFDLMPDCARMIKLIGIFFTYQIVLECKILSLNQQCNFFDKLFKHISNEEYFPSSFTIVSKILKSTTLIDPTAKLIYLDKIV
jgi:hypothetical protein